MNQNPVFSKEELETLENNLEKSHISHYVLTDAKNPSQHFQESYLKYLQKNYHAQMHYLENTPVKFSLDAFLPNTKTILTCLYPYLHPDSKKVHQKGYYKVAKYAHGKNYHNVIKKEFKKILSNFPSDKKRIIVDSTPFPERYYAKKANLGFIGKNGMLIHPKDGSYFFLLFVLFQQKIPDKYKNLETLQKIPKSFNTPKQDIEYFCKDCNLCVQACPTQAIMDDGIVDSNKCISYQTIEYHKVGTKYQAVPTKKHRWIFGCDVCQNVCPYNKKSILTTQPEFSPLSILNVITQKSMNLVEDKIEIPKLEGTSFKRIGIKGITKNQKYVDSL